MLRTSNPTSMTRGATEVVIRHTGSGTGSGVAALYLKNVAFAGDHFIQHRIHEETDEEA